MPYLFNDRFMQDLQCAFSTATIRSDLYEQSDKDKRDYFLIEFTQKPVIIFDEKNSVNMILAADKKISADCNNQLMNLATVEMGLRWQGLIDERRKIIFSAFCIKIIYSTNKDKLQHIVLDILCDFLKNQAFIHTEHDLRAQFNLSVRHTFAPHYHFFSIPTSRFLSETLLLAVKEYIKTAISPVFPVYIRPNEIAMNPAYQDITNARDKLFLHEKKIWLFRTDLILAVGNKNAYWISFSEKGLSDAIHASLHRFINWEDRYGHPSLATAYPDYPSTAFYGGLIAQREGYLEVFTSSGRYYRNDLDEKNKHILEAYVAYLFQQTYGRQPIVFVDSLSNEDYFECSLFYSDQALPDYCPKRKYDVVDIDSILLAVPTRVGFKKGD